MSRSILSSLCFVLVPGLLFLALYNIQTAHFHSRMHHHARVHVHTLPAIEFGSTLTIRHVSSTAGKYLHSHSLFYPTGKQQVTLAPQDSEATAWRIYNSSANYATREQDALQAPRQPVVAGVAVKLQHVATGKHLHSHQEHSPPISSGESLYEVTGYGIPWFEGDANDDWVVEPTEGGVLTTMLPFRLRHRITGCYLSSRGAALPEWGLGLQEVLCEPRGSADDLWIIEQAV
ncbi:MIR motif-containing protein [Mycena polygramma]|nr:MIR motif-containing protein [Mycena polygramma]